MFLRNEGMCEVSSPAVLTHPLRVHGRSPLPRLALNAAEEKDLSHVPRALPRARLTDIFAKWPLRLAPLAEWFQLSLRA